MSKISTLIEELMVVIRVFDSLCDNVECSKQAKTQLLPYEIRALTTRMRKILTQIKEAESHDDNVREELELLNKSCGQNVSSTTVASANSSVNAALKVSHNKLCNKESSEDNSKTKKATEKSSMFTVSKPSSVSVKKVEREAIPKERELISKDVARCFTCYLYNLLEGLANLTEATSASVFVKRDDEMLSIVNVRSRLSFPPQLVRHRCHNSPDAEVLGSGIALNQWVTDNSESIKSLLLFPIYMRKNYSVTAGNKAIAVLHLESKLGGVSAFNKFDEAIAYITSCLIGEIMFRVHEFDWLTNFYDPVTQHIIAPFIPAKYESMPKVTSQKADKVLNLQQECTSLERGNVEKAMLQKMSECEPEILICRKTLPARNTAAEAKASSFGLMEMPALREVSTFVDNVHSCWQKSVTKSIELTENNRAEQEQLRNLRRAVAQLQAELTTVKERLRLYELSSSDYKKEYFQIQSSLNAYLKSDKRLI